jgi:hypothetical protein
VEQASHHRNIGDEPKAMIPGRISFFTTKSEAIKAMRRPEVQERIEVWLRQDKSHLPINEAPSRSQQVTSCRAPRPLNHKARPVSSNCLHHRHSIQSSVGVFPHAPQLASSARSVGKAQHGEAMNRETWENLHRLGANIITHQDDPKPKRQSNACFKPPTSHTSPS